MLEQKIKTVLVAEDEPLLRTLLSTVLTKEGYNVLQAADGVDALSIADAYPTNAIDLLVSDICMPRMAGTELARHLCPSRPNMKVLFISSERVQPQDILLFRGAFLEKPFMLAIFANKVQEML